MIDITELLKDPNWHLRFEVDPNAGGDGPRIRCSGNSESFRTLAKILTTMANAVDDPKHPASPLGWNFALSDELPQLEIENAKLVVFDCTPSPGEEETE